MKTFTWFGGHSIFLMGQYFYILVVSAFPHTKYFSPPPSHPIPKSNPHPAPNYPPLPSQSHIRTHSTLNTHLPVIHPRIIPSSPTPHFTLSCAYKSQNNHTAISTLIHTPCDLLYPHPSIPRINPLRCVNSYAQPVDNFSNFCG